MDEREILKVMRDIGADQLKHLMFEDALFDAMESQLNERDAVRKKVVAVLKHARDWMASENTIKIECAAQVFSCLDEILPREDGDEDPDS